MKSMLLALTALTLLATVPASADVVEPALVGTWKLQWPRADFFWAVRPDGIYRMHGPGATRQLGKMEAKQGRFSMTSPIWTDAGTYTIGTADTLVITGQLGPGTWTRVWSPANRGSQQPPGSGTCVLLTEDEVAQVLRAPVSGGPDPKSPGGCVYQSQLGQFDRVHIPLPGSVDPASWLRNKAIPRPHVVDIPDVADGAYAEYQTDHVVVHMLKGTSAFKVRVSLIPAASKEDQAYLAGLARAAGRRLASFSPPGPTDAQLKRLQAERRPRRRDGRGDSPPVKAFPPRRVRSPSRGGDVPARGRKHARRGAMVPSERTGPLRLAEVRAAHRVVREELGPAPLEHDPPGLEHVGAVRHP